MRYEYRPRGVCSRNISFDIDGDHRITNISFVGGCNGNLKALSKAVDGKTAEEIAELFSGIDCAGKGTSCSDQLSRAVREAAEKIGDGTSAEIYAERKDLSETGCAFLPADIMLPSFYADAEKMKKWAVVACDQYTSQPEYWEKVESFVGSSPSSLRLVLPEIYLGKNEDERIAAINRSMREYISKGIFIEIKNALILTERKLSDGTCRYGIIGKIDLEKYDYAPGSETPVRASEKTVTERIPPRLRVRKSATIELPHVLVLIDDPKKTVVEPVCEKKGGLCKLYDFELMMGGGSVAGYLLSEEDAENVINALIGLSDVEKSAAAYGFADKKELIFAVGDGNHSLATAKAAYEKIKELYGASAAASHPARYALVEIENLRSDALEFEPIHRVVFETEPEKLIAYCKEKLGLEETSGAPGSDTVKIVTASGEKTYRITSGDSPLAVGSVQSAIDGYLASNGGRVDYIHGDGVTSRLARESADRVGFILPEIDKGSLFKTVVADGVLPRKTFSMGNAEDKRFYLEARKITK